MKLLEARALSYGLNSKRVFAEGLEFALHAGEVLWIQGPNGSGKSTLLRVLMQDLKPLAGSMEWKVAKDSLGYLPQLQNAGLHLPLTLGDVLGMAAKVTEDLEEQIDRIGILSIRASPCVEHCERGRAQADTFDSSPSEGSPCASLRRANQSSGSTESVRYSSCSRAWLKQDAGRALVLISHDSELLEAFGETRVRRLSIGAGKEHLLADGGDSFEKESTL